MIENSHHPLKLTMLTCCSTDTKDHLSGLSMELQLHAVAYLARRDVYSICQASQAMHRAADDRFRMLHRRLHVSLAKPSLAKLVSRSKNESLRTVVEEIGIIPSIYVSDSPSDPAVEKVLAQTLSRCPNCTRVVAAVPLPVSIRL